MSLRLHNRNRSFFDSFSESQSENNDHDYEKFIPGENNFEIAKSEVMDRKIIHLIYYLKHTGEYHLKACSKANGKIKCHLVVKDKFSVIIVDSYKHMKGNHVFDIEYTVCKEHIPVSLDLIFEWEPGSFAFLRRQSFVYEFSLKKVKEYNERTPVIQIPQSPMFDVKPDDFLLLSPDKRALFKSKYGEEVLKTIDGVVHELATKQKDSPIPTSHDGLTPDDSRVSQEWSDTALIIRSPRISKKRANSLNATSSRNLLKPKTRHWEKSNLIGEGAYGKVFLGLDQDHGNLIAIKQVDLDGIKVSLDKIKALESEIAMLSQLDHPNIVRYLGMEKTTEYLYIFLDYIAGGTIESIRKKFKLNESVVREYSREILHGLEYLHGKDILHRDIKTSNVLVDVNGMCLLSDFGSAKIVKELKREKVLEGTPNYMAPELMKNTKASDVYSFGCTVYEMLTGNPPFHSVLSNFKTPYEFLFWRERENPHLEIPDNISEKAKSFLAACLQEYPENRKSVGELLLHSFITENPEIEDERQDELVIFPEDQEDEPDAREKSITKSQSVEILSYLKETENANRGLVKSLI